MSALYVSIQHFLTENTLNPLLISGKEKYENYMNSCNVILVINDLKTNSDCHENAVSKSHTLLKAIKDFVPMIFKFLDQHRLYLVLEIYHIGVKKMRVSLNPMQ